MTKIPNSKQFKYFCILICSFVFCILHFAFCSAAILYLEPASASYNQGDIFLVEIRLDTQGEIINAIRVSLDFPPDILGVEDFSKGNSVLTLWPREPIFGQNIGLISFSGGVPGGYWGNNGLLGRLALRAKQETDTKLEYETNAKLNFLDDSIVLLNDGLGTSTNLITKGAVFEILAGVGERKNPWQEEIEKDDILPEPFKIELSQDPTIFEGRYFIVFSTVDKQTGINHYEVLETERAGWLRKLPWWKKEEWKIAESPYVLENQKLTSDIKVKAIDKAGNYWMEILEATNKPEEKQELYITLILILIALILTLVIIRMIQKKKKHE